MGAPCGRFRGARLAGGAAAGSQPFTLHRTALPAAQALSHRVPSPPRARRALRVLRAPFISAACAIAAAPCAALSPARSAPARSTSSSAPQAEVSGAAPYSAPHGALPPRPPVTLKW